MKKEKIKKWIYENKYWILTTTALTTLAVSEGVSNRKLRNQLNIKSGENKNQADIIVGLVKGVKNLAYHLGKKSTNTESNEQQ